MAVFQSSPVTINVYDMSWLNEYISGIGFGVYHTGVEVYDREYCYGGHQFGGSGIFEMFPRDTENLGPNYSFKTSIVVGCTDFTEHDVRTILSSMEKEFSGDQYHLLRKNCNHFSSALVEILCGAALPKWINRLASVSAKLPFIEKSIPKAWLTPLQQPENRTTASSETNDRPIQTVSRQSISGSTSSNPTTPDGTNTSQTISANSPGEQWRRFQTQVSSCFSRVSSSTTNRTERSSSISMFTPPNDKSTRRKRA